MNDLTPEVLAELERLSDLAEGPDGPEAERATAEWEDLVRDHAADLVAAARERDELRSVVGSVSLIELTRERDELRVKLAAAELHRKLAAVEADAAAMRGPLRSLVTGYGHTAGCQCDNQLCRDREAALSGTAGRELLAEVERLRANQRSDYYLCECGGLNCRPAGGTKPCDHCDRPLGKQVCMEVVWSIQKVEIERLRARVAELESRLPAEHITDQGETL